MRHLVALVLVLFCAPTLALASESPPTLDEVDQVIAGLIRVLHQDSTDSKMADTLEEALAERRADGRYRDAGTPDELAARLTTDLVEVSHDLHFHVIVDPAWVAAERAEADDDAARQRREDEAEQARLDNFGFRRVELLEGNVGYLNFTYFADPELAHETVAAVMTLLSNTDAVILDLRSNNGGYLEMAQLLCSYFLRSVPSQKLFEFSDLEQGQRLERQQWVLPSVSGDRKPDTPLFLLTSNTSFSSAEWFAFILKNLGRATLIGERTAGGAHPVQRRVLSDRFVVQIPTGIIRDGVRGEDFEGRGVEPDLSVAAVDALHVAHREALKALAEAHPDRRERYEWFLPVVEARLSAPRVAPDLLRSLAGSYGARQVLLERDMLYYSWDGEGRVRLLPLGETLLAVAGIDDFRFRILAENGVVTALERVSIDGRIRVLPKNGP